MPLVNQITRGSRVAGLKHSELAEGLYPSLYPDYGYSEGLRRT
jgi:hypothetical protein